MPAGTGQIGCKLGRRMGLRSPQTLTDGNFRGLGYMGSGKGVEWPLWALEWLTERRFLFFLFVLEEDNPSRIVFPAPCLPPFAFLFDLQATRAGGRGGKVGGRVLLEILGERAGVCDYL